MGVVEKAVFYIEKNLSQEFKLDDVANACGVSKFHLSRIFHRICGMSVIAHARARRLSVAAQRLADQTTGEILPLAIDAGYSSHEAFTRAFVNQFGVAPEKVRAAQNTNSINLVEPINMDASLLTTLQDPRFERREQFLVAGLTGRYTFETNHNIPDLWQRFSPHIGHIPGQIGWDTYGVCFNEDDKGAFDYMAGAAISGPIEASDDLSMVTIPTNNYAVFTHSGHISNFRKTVYTIWNKWLPDAHSKYAGDPDFELYDDRFDGNTGMGDVEIWIPVE